MEYTSRLLDSWGFGSVAQTKMNAFARQAREALWNMLGLARGYLTFFANNGLPQHHM